ncbi:hypothetical protein CEJ86_07480 [Sinorhizobium meliloti]|uniref:Uncharacterized protein n=1 Tax=Rhizobium meliloti TaxID=382 RepID=A0A2J0Z7V5_RHIML|nr:hypothetical protein CEJ86_07480 [Sinorhizobium meliloti]
MSILVYAHPDAANGIPFWTFGLTVLGHTPSRLAIHFLDWFTPPGAEDPFACIAAPSERTFSRRHVAAHHGISLTKRFAFAASFMSFRLK